MSSRRKPESPPCRATDCKKTPAFAGITGLLAYLVAPVIYSITICFLKMGKSATTPCSCFIRCSCRWPFDRWILDKYSVSFYFSHSFRFPDIVIPSDRLSISADPNSPSTPSIYSSAPLFCSPHLTSSCKGPQAPAIQIRKPGDGSGDFRLYPAISAVVRSPAIRFRHLQG